MCAIAGVLGPEVTEEIRRKMLKTMERRGPDGSGVWQEDGCTLLHSRLAVIDPAGGCQPMTLDRAGETYVLIYNGELYNTGELRLELMNLGHRFLGHSDTEVVLCSYAQWGEDCVNRFNGIFAFAVWEKNRKRLFLARDRIGVKPLFFLETKDGLLFASEMKTILAHPGSKAALDETGLFQLLLLGPGKLPGSGVFRNMRELKPGETGWYEDGKLRITRYWKLRDREHRDSFPETVEKVRFLVLDAIQRQMVSDVPVGTFLSGGLDSSIISAVCAREAEKEGKQLPTFSVDYAGNDRFFQAGKFQPESDNSYIRLMASHIGSNHHWTVLTPEILADTLEAATKARDLPGMADVDFSLLAFCREIRRDVTVALSGECADEIFGGYPWYRDPEIRESEGFPWAQNHSQRIGLLRPEQQGRGTEFVREAYAATCRESDVLPGTPALERRMKEMVNLNFEWFMQTLLDRKDRMSMYCSLEVRVPFCDYRIAEYLYAVPWEFKDHQGQEKGLLRQAVRGILPDAVLFRKKSPYPKTHDPAYGRIMAERLNRLLKRADAPLFSLVERKKLEILLSGDSLWPWYGQLMGRPQLIAYLLQMNYWMEDYKVDLCL